MTKSRIKFVILFLVFGFGFIFFTNGVLDQPAESILGADTQQPWQYVISTILSPFKAILIGPLLPFIKFLHQDPDAPPPFFLAGFAVYWTILALGIHFLIGKIKQVRQKA